MIVAFLDRPKLQKFTKEAIVNFLKSCASCNMFWHIHIDLEWSHEDGITMTYNKYNTLQNRLYKVSV